MVNCSTFPVNPFEKADKSIILCYLVVFTIAVLGNVTMFLILLRNQLIKVRRVHSLLLHMNIAHLMVTLIYMPKEIIHNYTVFWFGGDLLCRVCKFFDVFSVVLSMNILICISLDRFYSIFFPLYAMRARKSVQRMVTVAWTISFVSTAPQLFLFKNAQHPCYPYSQCVSADLTGDISKDVVFYYTIINVLQVYFLPLVITVLCYSLILVKINQETSEKEALEKNDLLLRRNGRNTLERARSRTLKMTFVIVLAFIICWTPYALLSFLHFLYKTTMIPSTVRKFVYAFAVFNSAISPYLYGYFSFDVRTELRLLVSGSKLTAAERHLSVSANITRSQQSQRVRKRSASTSNITVEESKNHVVEVAKSARVNSLRVPRKTADHQYRTPSPMTSLSESC